VTPELPVSPAPERSKGPPIPDYELIRLVGHGSYGDVWLARGLTGAYRAVKVVSRDRFTDLQPFHREFEGLTEFAAVSLTDADQLAMLHVGRNDAAGFFYYVMELADDVTTGREVDAEHYVPLTLKEMRARRGRLPAMECIRLGVILAGGLSRLHMSGLVHRDIKPSNVILVGGKPKLADIGLVASASDARTFVGTEGFVPPEGPGTPTADVFSLGKLLYEISTGLDRHDFPRLPAALDKQSDHQAFLELNEILLRACAPLAADRYPDASALLKDLCLLEAGRSVRRRRILGGAARLAAVLALIASVAGGLWWSLRLFTHPPAGAPAGPIAPAHSIAVLPFANLSTDPKVAFFADAMNEEVIAQLARIRSLKVTSREAVLRYRNGPRQLGQIAADLGVAYLLEGSVFRSGNQVRMTVQLTDTQSGRRIREASFDRDLNAVFSIQSALAQEISGALHADLTSDEQSAIGRWPTQDLAAFDLYLRARSLGHDSYFEPEPLGRAVDLYEQAVAKDPSFALAFARLALAHAMFYQYGHLDATPSRLARMKNAVDAAVRLAPDLPETKLALGTYLLFGRSQPAEALIQYRAAESRLPNDDHLLVMIGAAELWSGNWAQALAYTDRAAALNPQDATIAVTRCLISMFLRRYEEAGRLAAAGAARFSGNPLLPRLLARAQYQLDGDRPAFLRRWASMPLLPEDPHGRAAAFDLAMLYGDYALASQALADPQMPITFSAGHAAPEPVALKQALVAFLRGQPEAAVMAAKEAIAFYDAKRWTAAQKSAVGMEMALAHALAGDADEAIRQARAALAQVAGHNALVEADVRPGLGLVYATLGRREEALECLRGMMAAPCRQSPEEIRHDPLWARLSGDPRFETILNSAKRL